MTSYVLKCYCRLITRYRPHLSSAAQKGKSLKCCPNIRLKMTSLGDSSLTTRLGHNRKQNRTELIPLTEIHECETATWTDKRILKYAVQLYRYSTEAAVARLHKKEMQLCKLYLRFAFKLNSYDKTNKSSHLFHLFSKCCISECALRKYECHEGQRK